MNWNHRVVKDEEGMLRLVEVHYHENGRALGYTEPFMCSEDKEGLTELVNRLQMAINQPILNVEDITDVDTH